MNRQLQYFYIIISLTLAFFVAGIIFYLLYTEKLIFFWNHSEKAIIRETELMDKRACDLFYWNNSWQVENKDIIYSSNKIKSIRNLIVAWINLLEEESLLDKKFGIQSILMDNSNNIYISFDQPIFKKQISAYQKILFIHGILKTLQANTDIKSVQFLVQNKPLQDRHLDFSQPWPVSGYLIS